MWRRFQNLASSFNSYCALSPDLRLRRQVNESLCDRPALDMETWCTTFYPSPDTIQAIAAFSYTTLAYYSGLDFGRVRPGDRLEADLCWSQVCWFDWDLQLCDDFYTHFNRAVSDCFYSFDPVTIADIIQFLHEQLTTPAQTGE
jgi:hypothetical protein